MATVGTNPEPLITCASLDAFIGEVQRRSLTTAIVAWRAEWAPSSADGAPGQTHGDVRFGSLREVATLAYDRGTLIRWEAPADGPTREAVTARLTAAGLRVEERCRNIS